MNLKDKIEKTLKGKKIEYRLAPLPDDVPLNIDVHVAHFGIERKNVLSTLIYRTENGLVAVQRRADTKVDENKLRELLQVKELSFANANDLESLGVEKGTVAVVGLDIPYVTDKKALEVSEIYGGVGVREFKIILNPKDVVLVNTATVGDFSYVEEKLETPKNKRFLSGITPSGDGSLHIGNYLGAVRQFIELAKNNETYLMVADLHALTTIQDKKQLQHNVETAIVNELALLKGFLTPEEFDRVTFFRQSDVPMHTECQSILNNVTPLGMLKRAHAYKDKLQKDVMEDDINVGLFSYPMLMAADILLYQPDLVPVGKDQKQHIEITRDIADRFNKIFKKQVFKLPEPYIPEEVAVVLGTDGKRKMSKTLGNIISIFESEDVIAKQVNGVYTDPTRKHATDPGHIEGNMVFVYLDFFGEPSKVSELKELYTKGQVGDIEVKKYLLEILLKTFKNAREKYADLVAHPEKVKAILEVGATRAKSVAMATMQELRESIGLKNQYSIMKNTTINEMKVGKVLEATNKEGSEKLIRLVVDIAENTPRIIFTGVRPFGYTPEFFVGKQFFFFTDLPPRKMLDEYSQGMIMAVDGADKPIFLSAEGMTVGAQIR